MQRKARLFDATISTLLTLVLLLALSAGGYAADKSRNTAEGPFETLVIRGAMLIDGTGTPPRGPVNIVVNGNTITSVGGGPIPEDAKVIDANGMYVMPGFVDTHAHIGRQFLGEDYVYKLWMAHGVTTIREAGGGGSEWTRTQKELSANNEIVAPRMYIYARPGGGWSGGPINTPESAREYVRWAQEQGIDGLKLGGHYPDIMEALIDEAVELGLGTTTHLPQTHVLKDAIPNMTRWGLGSVEHWYGVPESLLDEQTVQRFTADYNYNNEYDRFSQAGRLWAEAAPPGSETWERVMNEYLTYGLTMSPTFGIYEATRDVSRVKNDEWHEKYTAPALQAFFEPSLTNHGSFFFDWTTADEIAWKENFRLWMQFINEYKNRGGRVTAGSDSGFIYRTYGFGYIRELELLQEAGFHPLEVIRAATMHGAQLLAEQNNEPLTFGIIRPGMLADILVVEENPLHNLKTLYGTGAMKLDPETGEVNYVGGVKYTIKDGIVYDAKQLLADVEEMVQLAKEEAADD